MDRGVIFEALCVIYIFKNLYVETAEIYWDVNRNQ